MFTSNRLSRSWIVHTASATHLLWAGLLFTGHNVIDGVTSVAMSEKLIGSHVSSALFYLAAAIMATAAGYLFSRLEKWQSLALLMPQQFLLLLSAAGAIQCSLNNRFADGVPHDGIFIFADQSWVIFGALFHTIAIVSCYGRAGKS